MDEIFGEENFAAQFFCCERQLLHSSQKLPPENGATNLLQKMVTKKLSLFGGETEGGDMPHSTKGMPFAKLNFQKKHLVE